MKIGTQPVQFTLDKWDSGTYTFDNSVLGEKVVLLSFIDIVNGKDWLNNLKIIRTDSSLEQVEIIAVLFKYEGDIFQQQSEVITVVRDVFPSPNEPTFPICVNGSGQSTSDLLKWSPSTAKTYLEGYYNDDSPPFLNDTALQNLFSYIIGKDKNITDKWHRNSTSKGEPVAMNRLKNIPGYDSFDSNDLTNTEKYVTPRLLNLNDVPKILSTIPHEGSTVSNLSNIEISFTKPLNIAETINTSNYSLTGGGKGTLLSNPDFAIYDYNKKQIENYVTLQFATGAPVDSPLNDLKITLSTNIKDTINPPIHCPAQGR